MNDKESISRISRRSDQKVPISTSKYENSTENLFEHVQISRNLQARILWLINLNFAMVILMIFFDRFFLFFFRDYCENLNKCS